jgi:uncharacterized protein (DUF2141 family)
VRGYSVLRILGIGAAILFLAGELSAQPFVKDVYGTRVFSGGEEIVHPFTGGFYNPSHQFVDIDDDGDVDLFIFDPNDNSLHFFRNTGTTQAPTFRYEHHPFTFPAALGWVRFVDVNGDGKKDFLTAGDSINSIAIYHNNGTGQNPAFTLWTPVLRDSAGHIVHAELNSIPSFADIDNDGDLDLFTLNTAIGTINFYENIGSPQNLLLTLKSNRWQNLQICPGCKLKSGELPVFASPGTSGSLRHGNGTMTFADIDGDGDLDLFYGDLFDSGVLFFRNNGTPLVPILDTVYVRFPPGSPVVTGGFNQPSFADIDGDGDLDFFISVMPPFQRFDNFWFFRNIGTATAFNFVLETKNYLSTLDMGIHSAPAFVDIDGDGDLDMFIGELFGGVSFWRNTGTPSAPQFVLVDSSFYSSATRFALVPVFVDIDDNGTADMFIGHFAGNIEFHRNIGTPTSPQFQREVSFFDSVNVGNYAAPAFFDINGDGDLDLFVGKADGRISFYRNDGTPQSFAYTLVSTNFAGIDVGFNAKPSFADVDGDGLIDLLVGASDGKIHYYRNTGSAGNPVFTFMTDAFGSVDRMYESIPVLVDIDGDGDVDLFVGHLRGGVEFYRNDRITTSVPRRDEAVPATVSLLGSYPNPFNPSTTIEFTVHGHQPVAIRLSVLDILGREVAVLVDGPATQGHHAVMWDASKRAAGVYFCRLQSGARQDVMKILLLK